MNREDLIEKLELVSPALSKINLVPVLQHYWFYPNHIVAFNDQIAIEVKFASGFSGAVPNTLLSLLTASKADKVDFKVPKKGTLEIKAASSKFKLPFLDTDDTNIFVMPDPDKSKALSIDINKFLEAMTMVMRSLKENPSMPDSLGVTLSFIDPSISLFATNDATISFAWVDAGSSDRKPFRAVLSGAFCRQMLALSKLEGEKHLEIHSDYSLFVCGEVVLFGRLVDVPKPLDFDAVIEQAFPIVREKELVSVPSKLELILDRSIIITDKDNSVMEIHVEDGIANFLSKSAAKGEVRDHMQMEEHHPDVSINIDPRLFKHGFGHYNKMLLTERCLVMVNDDHFLYLVSATQ